MNGKKTRFWSDPWLYEKPLYATIPVLFILCNQKEVSVADVKSGRVEITFRRWLPAELQSESSLIELDTTSNFMLMMIKSHGSLGSKGNLQ